MLTEIINYTASSGTSIALMITTIATILIATLYNLMKRFWYLPRYDKLNELLNLVLGETTATGMQKRLEELKRVLDQYGMKETEFYSNVHNASKRLNSTPGGNTLTLTQYSLDGYLDYTDKGDSLMRTPEGKFFRFLKWATRASCAILIIIVVIWGCVVFIQFAP